MPAAVPRTLAVVFAAKPGRAAAAGYPTARNGRHTTIVAFRRLERETPSLFGRYGGWCLENAVNDDCYFVCRQQSLRDIVMSREMDEYVHIEILFYELHYT